MFGRRQVFANLANFVANFFSSSFILLFLLLLQLCKTSSIHSFVHQCVAQVFWWSWNCVINHGRWRCSNQLVAANEKRVSVLSDFVRSTNTNDNYDVNDNNYSKATATFTWFYLEWCESPAISFWQVKIFKINFLLQNIHSSWQYWYFDKVWPGLLKVFLYIIKSCFKVRH